MTSKSVVSLLVALAIVVSAGQVSGDDYSLPLVRPDRPFLLIAAERRFLPSEHARVRVQGRRAGAIQLALYRIHDPMSVLARGFARQGVAIADLPLGGEPEGLLTSATPMPRRGAHETLISTRSVPLRMRQPRPRMVDESVAYDGYNSIESDVETWGVESGRWAEASIDLGVLPSGLYLVRALDGSWGSATLLSVGDNSLLVRRGDRVDQVRVVGPNGAPRANVHVEAREGSTLIVSGTTDAEGAVAFAGSDRPSLRFIAASGNDVAFTDVAHARMGACDPRVYLAVGRPTFRVGEVVHVRGHARGCDVQGNEIPLAHERIELRPAREGSTEAITDDRGDFVAELVAPAEGELSAQLRGHDSVRTIQIDHRNLPERALRMTTDRTFAAPGDEVVVSVMDDEGGWPTRTSVRLETPGGTFNVPIGPGVRGVARFRVPRTSEVLERAEIVATLASPGRVQSARAEIVVSRQPEWIEIATDRAYGRSGDALPIRIRVTDVAGHSRSGAVRIALYGSDGNRPIGNRRALLERTTDDRGELAIDLPLTGEGPWWVRAEHDTAFGSLVVRDRALPPPLSTRGELMVRPVLDVIDPGADLEVELRAPREGATWLTLEQGGVQSSQWIRGGGVQRARLTVPASARGMASVVATHVQGADVREASATIEVRTSQPIALSVATDRRSYAEGQIAHVSLDARDPRGTPREAVASIWMADAGYWELGEEQHPSPDRFFRLPGRPASGGNGSRPLTYGAEEGRQIDSWIEWNGARLERSTFRHAWGFGGDLVSLERRASVGDLAIEIARSAHLRGAEVCERLPRTEVNLRAHAVPWDLLVVRVQERASDAFDVELDPAYVRNDVLHVPCAGHGMQTLGNIGASGYGSGGGGYGMGSGGLAREEHLEGDLFFAGLVRLVDGHAEMDVPMPSHPGRFRIEAIAIANDGGGSSAHAIAHTSRAIQLSLHVPRRLAVGDASQAELEIHAPSFAGRELPVTIDVEPNGAIVLEGLRSDPVLLDGDGHARLPFEVRAQRAATTSINVSAALEGGAGDRIRTPIVIDSSHTSQPISVSAWVSSGETHVPLPHTDASFMLDVRLDAGTEPAIRNAWVALGEPRWAIAPLRIDRMGALLALERAAASLPDRSALVRELRQAVVGEGEAILRLIEADVGGDGRASVWRGLGRNDAMTAELLWMLWPIDDDAEHDVRLQRIVEALDRAAERGAISPSQGAIVAAALARSGRADRARRLLSRSDLGSIDALVWAIRAAGDLHDPLAPYHARLEREIERRLSQSAPMGAGCSGPAYFLCFARMSERAELARAGEAWLAGDHPNARALAGRLLLRIVASPVETGFWDWGSSDADVIAFLARFDAGDDAGAVTVSRGGRTIARITDQHTIAVPPGDGPLVLRSVGPSPTRVHSVRIDGEVAVDPNTSALGTVRLVRRVDLGESPRLEVEFEMARDQDDVVIRLPLAAGLELASTIAHPRIGVRASGRRWRWYSADPDLGSEVPSITHEGDALVLRWSRLRAGTIAVRIPVVVTARGSFTAGAASLRSGDRESWAITRPLGLTL